MLRIVGRRADGYHELQTVFQFLSHCDELSFSISSDTKVILRTPMADIPDESNLIMRAARLLQTHTGTSRGVEISIDKKLPMGGGLGGGSSDAATTLVALNRLWETGLSNLQLQSLGRRLGADVPIFIHGRAAWAEGVGDDLDDLELSEPWYLVITPQCHVSTAAIFAAEDLTRNSPRIKIRDFLQGDRTNDCLPVVCKRHPEVAGAIAWLERHARAQLTGTGACVFAEFPSAEQARAILKQAPKGITGFVARGLNRSPLIDRIEVD